MCTFLYFKFSGLVNSEFVITPKNTCAFIGEMPELHCSLSTTVFQYWKGPNNDYISQNDKVDQKYEGKFDIFGAITSAY